MFVHSILEGVAISIQPEFDLALMLAIGIALHHLCASVVLGGTIANTDFSTISKVINMLFFAVSLPLGMLIGLAIDHKSELLNAILMSLSAGTFIYVSCSEIL